MATINLIRKANILYVSEIVTFLFHWKIIAFSLKVAKIKLRSKFKKLFKVQTETFLHFLPYALSSILLIKYRGRIRSAYSEIVDNHCMFFTCVWYNLSSDYIRFHGNWTKPILRWDSWNNHIGPKLITIKSFIFLSYQ